MNLSNHNFIKLDDFKPHLAENADVLAHWKTARQEASVPKWRLFDPLDIASHLTNCTFLEFVSDDEIKVQMFGSNLVDRNHADLTGTNFLDYFQAQYRDEFLERLALLKTRPAALCSILKTETNSDAPALIEALHLPFFGDDSRVEWGLMSMFAWPKGKETPTPQHSVVLL